MKFSLSLLCFLALPFSFLTAQVATDSELFIALKMLDSLIFEQGFNKCLIQDFESLIHEEIEFYHDKGGLTEGKETFVRSVQQNICANPNGKMSRQLRKGTLHVFPLYERGLLYGAIQSGDHAFYISQGEESPVQVGVAKFTHLWIKTVDGWRLKRVLSYDHQEVNL